MTVPRFDAPALLLLALPVGLVYWRVLRAPGQRRLQTLLHAALLALPLLALAGPYLPAPTHAIDLVIVADRSRSMPPEAEARASELIALIERRRPPGARIGVIAAGAEAHVEQLPSADAAFPGFTKPVDPDGSNLAAAVETALNLVPADRAGRVLLLTDGLATGRSPLGAASVAAAREVPVDYRLFDRPRVKDVAIERVVLPPETDAGSALQVCAWIRADRAGPVKYRCWRGDTLISEGETTVPAGSHPLYFRDRLPPHGGLYRYRVEVPAADDPTPENNAAAAVLRARDIPRLLLVTTHAAPDNVARALSAAGFALDVAPPARMPQDAAGLDAYRGIVLEDVSANDLGARALQGLVRFVEEGGGGLLVTGGRASFGAGGYFKSDLDPVLPVSMEMRQEHRKFRMALAIALDRSGSMQMPVAGGLVKMDLADRGTAEAVRMLSPTDEVAVIAVDSIAHIVQPLTKVDDPEPIAKRVLRIQSEGGGIFTYTALLAAGKTLEESTAATRHILLFADADDAEEPGDYQELMKKYGKAGITVSVIGLGTDRDSGADFLKDVARRGNGRMFFSNRPEDLPRLFAQETMTVARSTFSDEPVAAKWMPDAHLLGEVARTPLPVLGGYNLTYLRPDAALGAVTQDESKAPVLAFWHRGVGRAAALTAEADGPTSGPLLKWSGYGTLMVGLGRWLLGPDEPEGVSVSMKIEEPDVALTLEYDPQSELGREVPREPPTLSLLTADADAPPARVPFEWTGERTLEARFTMKREGVYLPVVRLAGGRIVKAPPVTLPYSPEFLPRTGWEGPSGPDTPAIAPGRALPPGEPGRALLDEIAARTGGRERSSVEDIFEATGTRVRDRLPLRMPLAVATLALLLFEVAARRLHWWELAAAVKAEEILDAAARVTRRLVAPGRAGAAREEPGAPPAIPVRPAAAPPGPAASPASAPASAPAATAPPDTIGSALDMAKRKAKRRYGDR